MNIRQLESDLRAKKEAIAALIQDLSQKAKADNDRLLTDEEKAPVRAAMAEAETLQGRIDAARDDAAFLAKVHDLTGGTRHNGQNGTDLMPRRADSVGQQFVGSAEYQALIKGGLRRGSSFSSGAVECFDPMMLRATTLTEDPASGGKLLVPQYLPGIVGLNFKRLVVADLLAPGTTDTNSIIYMVETTFTNAAAPTAEGAAKPESALVFDQRTDPVAKIAHWLPVTEELLEDVSAIRAYIDARLRLGVQLAEEDQLLNGNGTPPNIMGIMNRTGLATAVARNAGATPAETNAEAILRQITAIATTSFVYPDGIAINPSNWFSTVTMKTTTGEYFGGGPFSTLPTPALWGVPAAVTPTIVAGTALVGAYGTMAQFFRRGGLRVEASNSHQDYFIKNLVAIRAEERGALAVYRPGAFGKVTGLS